MARRTSFSAADDTIAGLLGDLYDAATGQLGWPVVLERLVEMTGSRSISLTAGSPGHIGRLEFGNSDEYWDEYSRHFFAEDFRMTTLRTSRPMTVMTDADPRFVPPETDTRGLYDFLRRHDRRYGMGALLSRDGDAWTMAAFIRGAREEPPDAETLRLFGYLAPHLRRAVDLQLRLGGLRAETAVTAGLLEHSPYGIAVVDGHCRVKWLNDRARRSVADGSAVAIRGGLLVGRSADDTRWLRRMIGGTARTILGLPGEAGGTLSIERPGLPPTAVTVAPLPVGRVAANDGGFDGLNDLAPSVGIFISDPLVPRAPPADTLRRAYRLQPAQARLAVALADGQSIAGYADEAGVTVRTARERVKQVLTLTGTHRQAELVRLVLGLPAEPVG
ncbi:hypothetical protein [Inquilinus sp. CAU 1745]|uniref:helix-turn-helix transcriptional regulator n=1 Tax=Inquilinus sp. CAU 1745 TaxID=3140369 RepID=UPI00325AB4F7